MLTYCFLVWIADITKKDIVPDNLSEGFMQMEKLIKEQPTVYDVDKL